MNKNIVIVQEAKMSKEDIYYEVMGLSDIVADMLSEVSVELGGESYDEVFPPKKRDIYETLMIEAAKIRYYEEKDNE